MYVMSPYLIYILAIIFINTTLFSLPYILNSNPMNFNRLLWKDNRAISNGEWYRILTCIFVHANFLHLFLNMVYLYYIGSGVFSVLNGIFSFTPYFKTVPIFFLFIYLGSGIIASFASYMFNRANSLGASGAVYGLFGFIIMFNLFSGNYEAIFSSILSLVILGVTSKYMEDHDHVAHWAGVASGSIFALALICYIKFVLAVL
jgi:rhomboid protease GluP